MRSEKPKKQINLFSFLKWAIIISSILSLFYLHPLFLFGIFFGIIFFDLPFMLFSTVQKMIMFYRYRLIQKLYNKNVSEQEKLKIILKIPKMPLNEAKIAIPSLFQIFEQTSSDHFLHVASFDVLSVILSPSAKICLDNFLAKNPQYFSTQKDENGLA